jgi:hypothetical protein
MGIICVEFSFSLLAEMLFRPICLLITITVIRCNSQPNPLMSCIPQLTPCINKITREQKTEVLDNCGKKSSCLSDSKGYIAGGQEIEWDNAPWTSAIVMHPKLVSYPS